MEMASSHSSRTLVRKNEVMHTLLQVNHGLLGRDIETKDKGSIADRDEPDQLSPHQIQPEYEE